MVGTSNESVPESWPLNICSDTALGQNTSKLPKSLVYVHPHGNMVDITGTPRFHKRGYPKWMVYKGTSY